MRKSLGVLTVALLGIFVSYAHADSITFTTPAGSTTGGQAVDASATFTTSAGSIKITLVNLEANPTSVIQAISDLDFVLSNGATTGTLTSSSGQEITIQAGGAFTLGPSVDTGWALTDNVAGGLQLDVLGTPMAPAHLVIGPPGSTGYTNANGSIAGNGPHNPFLNQATFFVDVPGVTDQTTITGVTFSFGTTPGNDVPGTPLGVPEPSSLLLLLAGAFVVITLLHNSRWSGQPAVRQV